MKAKDALHFPKLTELGEFGRAEFVNGISDIRHALIDEAWFGRARASPNVNHHPSLGWELSDEVRAERNSEDPFGHRWSAEDEKRRSPDHDQTQELDFDR